MKEKTVGASKGWRRFKTCSQKHIVVDDYCSTLLQPEAWTRSMRWERSTKWLMSVPFLVRNPIFSTDWLGICMALESKSQWKNSRKRHWLQRSKFSFLLKMTLSHMMADTEWCRPFGPVLSHSPSIQEPLESGSWTSLLASALWSEVLCFQGTLAFKWEPRKWNRYCLSQCLRNW